MNPTYIFNCCLTGWVTPLQDISVIHDLYSAQGRSQGRMFGGAWTTTGNFWSKGLNPLMILKYATDTSNC